MIKLKLLTTFCDINRKDVLLYSNYSIGEWGGMTEGVRGGGEIHFEVFFYFHAQSKWGMYNEYVLVKIVNNFGVFAETTEYPQQNVQNKLSSTKSYLSPALYPHIHYQKLGYHYENYN